ncbi:hypothetical protein NFIA_050560 [Paecilomyces variotii No. 5]|uniref:Small subunit of serine palmitoyltransferase-like protein n=1 Tax=Byssochlamys spectabilis (strain No. 5 / NBRC 109023) TaxID=1356009 RepID=V5F6Y7_BYSSN|nr:hypothetical protein NFIA_050560 [Paecilomyces variotii No. 5]
MEFIFWMISSLIRWVRLKIYQYEVTFAIYMLTPTEKFIFNSLLLTLITLLSTAAYVYLPDHVKSICGHIYYYWAGDRPFSDYLPSPSSLLRDNSTKTLEVIYETAQDAATAAAAATVRVAEL